MKNSITSSTKSILSEFGSPYTFALLGAGSLSVIVAIMDILVIALVGFVTADLMNAPAPFNYAINPGQILDFENAILLLLIAAVANFFAKILFLNYTIKLSHIYGNKYVETIISNFLRKPHYASEMSDTQFTNLVVNKGSSFTLSFISGQLQFITNLCALIIMLFFAILVGGWNSLIMVLSIAGAYVLFGFATGRSIDQRSTAINRATNNLFSFASEISFLYPDIRSLNRQGAYQGFFSENLGALRNLQRKNLLNSQSPRYFLDLIIYVSLGLALLALPVTEASFNTTVVVMLLFTFQKSVPFFQSMYAGWVQMNSELSFISDLIQFKALLNSQADEPSSSLNDIRLKFKTIEFQNLQVGLPHAGRRLNNEVSFVINRHDIILLKGESGKGKSSLLKFILGLNVLKSGHIFIDGKEQKRLPNLKAAFVGQSPRAMDGSILEYITLRADVSQTQKQKVINLLENLGLNEFVHVIDDKSVRNFSGGQLQRLAIIRAIVNDCDMLLLDEPTSALDAHAAAKVLALLEDIRGLCTVVIVTHENSFDELADRIEYIL